MYMYKRLVNVSTKIVTFLHDLWVPARDGRKFWAFYPVSGLCRAETVL